PRGSADRRTATRQGWSLALPSSPGSLDSHPLAHPSGEDAQLVAILGDRASGDLDPLLLQDIDDRLVGERLRRVLLRDQLLDLGLATAGGYLLPRGRGQGRGAEEPPRQQPTRRHHLLRVGYPRI